MRGARGGAVRNLCVTPVTVRRRASSERHQKERTRGYSPSRQGVCEDAATLEERLCASCNCLLPRLSPPDLIDALVVLKPLSSYARHLLEQRYYDYSDIPVSFISSRFLISYSKPSMIYCTPGFSALCRHWFLLSKNPLPHWLLPSNGEAGRECFQFNCEGQNRWSFPAASGERLELSYLWIPSSNIQIHGCFLGVLVYLQNFPLVSRIVQRICFIALLFELEVDLELFQVLWSLLPFPHPWRAVMISTTPRSVRVRLDYISENAFRSMVQYLVCHVVLITGLLWLLLLLLFLLFYEAEQLLPTQSNYWVSCRPTSRSRNKTRAG